MKLFLLTLFLSSVLYAQGPYEWKVIRAIDGDTVEIQVDFLPSELGNKLHIRIWGVDTPEKGFRAQSEHEKELGLKASEFTKNAIANAKEIKVSLIMWDKFGGRVLGDLIIDGKSLRQLLLDNGYAREYYGNKKKSWDDFN
ncbi:MAG: thermonuclease family protein [Alphaproteobacteria bacterium]|nr:thermonuclease family protein [Alphaproteobacteria bacterium]